MKKKILLLILAITITLTTGCKSSNTDLNELETSQENELKEISVNQEPIDQSSPIKFAPEETNEYRIVMVGDILLHDRVEESCLTEKGTYNYDSIFEHVLEDVNSAKLAIVNQEVIIGGSEMGISGYPAFNAPYELADKLKETGFDIICHGTNHALDKGSKGLLNCLNYWNEKYPEIKVLGIHDSNESQKAISYVELDSEHKIAILNYTYGTNGINPPDDMPYIVDYLNENKVINDLQEAEENADFTIVCPHWGTEYSLQIDSMQKKWAKIFVENGADLIIGTHPHVIEPIEWYNDEESGNKALIYYSLGNFVNWTSGEGQGVSNRMVGGMADVTLTIKDNNVEIEKYSVIPLVSHVTSGYQGVTVYKLSDYTDELAKANEINNQTSDFSLDYCKKLVENIWGM